MARTKPETRPAADSAAMPGFRPLYGQVRDTLIRRLVDGVWQPGQPLPSEIQLAAELGVSQGTVRKALELDGRRQSGGAPPGPRHLRRQA